MLTKKKFKCTTKKGQLMLWRSGIGCDLVKFVNDHDTSFRYTVMMLTGRSAGCYSTLLEYELRDTTKEVYTRYKNLHFKF